MPGEASVAKRQYDQFGGAVGGKLFSYQSRDLGKGLGGGPGGGCGDGESPGDIDDRDLDGTMGVDADGR